MPRRFLSKLALAMALAVTLVSYTERWQAEALMPLRNMLMVPDRVMVEGVSDSLPGNLSLKSGPDGYYVNPWQAASTVSPVAERVLEQGCIDIPFEDRRRLLSVADYFRSTAEYRGDGRHGQFAVWSYPIHFEYGVTPGWISGMAQARIALVLAGVSACAFGEDAAGFESLSRLAVDSLQVEVEKGGALVNLPGGNWYEEYAQSGVQPPLVLNGHVYALLALARLRNVDDRAEGLYQSGLSALEQHLHHYDAITWSYYDRTGTPANNIYQQALHARQMKELHTLTGAEKFRDYHRRFSFQRASPFSSAQRFIIRPSRLLGFLLLVNFLVIFLGILLFDTLTSRVEKST